MNATFKLHLGPDPIAGGLSGLYRHGDVLVSTHIGFGGVEHFHTPAELVKVLGVHTREISRKQCGFFPTFAGLHLQHNIVTIMRVTGRQQICELFF